jgi:tetratricopeptide (TPR) repeat protein
VAAPPPDPPSHDETMIESSILEVPPSYSEPALPPRPVRKGPIVASLLLAVFSLVGGGFVLYGRSLDEQERVFLALAQATLDAGDDPGPALAVAGELPGALKSRVSVLSLTEQLEARAKSLEARAQADALLAGAAQDADLAARGERLQRAVELAPKSPRLQALLAHHQLEVWARQPEPPRAKDWEALSTRLEALAAEPSVLCARARVALAAQGRDPGARSGALGSLSKAGVASEIRDRGEARWASYARGWRAVLAQEPQAARAPLDALVGDPQGDPILASLATTLRARVRWTRGDSTGAAADLQAARRLDPLAEGPAAWGAWIHSEVGDATGGQLAAVAKRWPRSATALAAWAQVVGAEEPELGLKRAQEALARDRGSDLAHLVAARLTARRGRLDEAHGHAVKSVLWGRSLAAHLLRIELGLARRDLEFAQQDLRAAQALAPQDLRVVLWEGRVALRAGRGQEALRLGQELLKRSPDWVEGHVLTARAQAALERWQEASARVEEAVKLDPSHPEARLARAQVLVATNQSVLALTDLEQLNAKRLTGALLAEAAYLKARAHRELGEVPRAQAAYRSFLKLAHQNDVRRRLAAAYLREGGRR